MTGGEDKIPSAQRARQIRRSDDRNLTIAPSREILSDRIDLGAGEIGLQPRASEHVAQLCKGLGAEHGRDAAGDNGIDDLAWDAGLRK